MICQKSGQPTDLCEECQQMKDEVRKGTADKVTPARNDVAVPQKLPEVKDAE